MLWALFEVNFFADPFAVKELLVDDDDDIGITRFLKQHVALLPLDITTPHELPFEAYAARVDPTFTVGQAATAAEDGGLTDEDGGLSKSPNPITYFTSAFLRRSRAVMREFGKDAMEYVHFLAFQLPSFVPRFRGFC